MWFRRTIFCLLLVVLLSAGAGRATAVEPINIGSQLEPLIDDYLIDQQSGDLKLTLHHPVRHAADSVTFDRSWEGNNCSYITVLKDKDTFLMYYRGSELVLGDGSAGTFFATAPRYATTCVMTSKDGIHWTRPDLGFVKYKGWENNNIILTFDQDCGVDLFKGDNPDDGKDLLSGKRVKFTSAVHNFTPMIDTNPDCKPDERFKAVGGEQFRLLYAYKSPDGIHWSLMQEEPIISDGMLDSQNLTFWDPVQRCYYAYYRDYKNKKGDRRELNPKEDYSDMDRDVRFATSTDFIHWTPGEWVDWQPDRMTELYTNQIQLYPGNEHLRIGFPMRYILDRGLFSKINERIAKARPSYGAKYTDTGLVTSRDGRSFKVWPEALVRPGPTIENWYYTFGETSLNLFETPSLYPGGANEWSMYVLDHGAWLGNGVSFNRYSIRRDGFVSASSPIAGGSLVTKPIIFAGKTLEINFETSANGSVRVELQDSDGKPLRGFSLDECPSIFGNSVAYAVKWNSDAKLADYAGKPVRLRFALRDADLYAFRFVEK